MSSSDEGYCCRKPEANTQLGEFRPAGDTIEPLYYDLEKS
jgi:hypothetical protein